jgi:hypothetical protein
VLVQEGGGCLVVDLSPAGIVNAMRITYELRMPTPDWMRLNPGPLVRVLDRVVAEVVVDEPSRSTMKPSPSRVTCGVVSVEAIAGRAGSD